MNLRLLLFTLLTPFLATAQFLAPNTSLQEAYKLATQQDKLIFLMIEAADCQQCADVADKALQNDILKNYLKENFIAIRIPAEHPDVSFLKEKYNTHGGNSVLFLDNFGTLVFRTEMSAIDHRQYTSQGGYAMARKAEASRLRALEQEALTGKFTTGQIYELMNKRKAIDQPIDALLNQYVSQLPEDSLNGITTIKRIANLSPILQSKADLAMRKNAALFNELWNNKFNSTDRALISKDIALKSLQQAIAEKNVSKATEAARFAQLSFSDKAQGEKEYYSHLMVFFQNTNDTAAYLQSAVEYYERFLKGLNAADIKMYDSTQMASLAQQLFSSKPPCDTTGGRSHIIRRSEFNTTLGNYYSQKFINGARSFYNMTNDPAYLQKAQQWAAYAWQFKESPYVLDIWARLLYKVDKKKVDQAVQLEEEAIALLQKWGFPTTKNKEAVTKMKKMLPL
ncbi:thioredoxin family protein [Niastella sp. OAS944]|uniref:thioredoxin family protein n=1 Tax=Niastella sp. OAS944 TaxID=2664089 RepID=UPI00349823D7|nr:hypothetical protein [Chitinophagaceae bacterium OAS944]